MERVTETIVRGSKSGSQLIDGQADTFELGSRRLDDALHEPVGLGHDRYDGSQPSVMPEAVACVDRRADAC
jgi:hypothetical protein